MANSVDPDQTAPWGAVWSGSTLFAQTCLSENLGSFMLTHRFWDFSWCLLIELLSRNQIYFFILWPKYKTIPEWGCFNFLVLKLIFLRENSGKHKKIWCRKDSLGGIFRISLYNLMLCVLIRMASVRKFFQVPTTYMFLLKNLENYLDVIIKWATSWQNQKKWMCAQHSKWMCASAQSDQSLRCELNG